MADGTDNEKAFAKACEKVGHTYAMPHDVTRTLKQVVSEASQLVAAAASVSSRTTSPVKLLSSASVAASTRPAGPAIRSLAAELERCATEVTEAGTGLTNEATVPSAVSRVVVEEDGLSDLSRFLDPSPAVSSGGGGTSSTSEVDLLL